MIGTMRALDDTRGAVRLADADDTDIPDLWEAGTAFQPSSDHCLTYADPIDDPFCLSTWEGRHLWLTTAPERR